MSDQGPRPGFTPPLLAALPHWINELESDSDQEFIISGIKSGFSLVDSGVDLDQINSVQTKNSVSATKEPFKSKVDVKIKEELSASNYVQVGKPPKIISALATVPKPDGDIRLIHEQTTGRWLKHLCV